MRIAVLVPLSGDASQSRIGQALANAAALAASGGAEVHPQSTLSARRIAELAAEPVHQERRDLWYAQNRLQPLRPVVYCSPEGSWVELLPDSDLQCEDDDARGLEPDDVALAGRRRVVPLALKHVGPVDTRGDGAHQHLPRPGKAADA